LYQKLTGRQKQQIGFSAQRRSDHKKATDREISQVIHTKMAVFEVFLADKVKAWV
jgi:hypothetical protein